MTVTFTASTISSSMTRPEDDLGLLVRRFVHQVGKRVLDDMYVCAYALAVEVEWDPRKAAANAWKHRIDFADAATVLHDELAVTVPTMSLTKRGS